MADVFVSYSRRDKARVVPLVAAIEARGWSVWWDPEIVPGQEFDRTIDKELEGAAAVVVVWTRISVDSRWVRGEAREATERTCRSTCARSTRSTSMIRRRTPAARRSRRCFARSTA